MTNEEQAAVRTVEDFLGGYAERNVERCISAFVSSRPVTLFGTNEDEVFKSLDDLRAALTKDFAVMSHIRWGKYRQFHVEAVDTLASVTVELPLAYQSAGKDLATPFRYAFTLVKDNDQWKISSCLASVPFVAGTYVFPE